MQLELGFPRDVPGQTGTGRPVVPLSRDKKVLAVPLCRKVALSRPVGNPMVMSIRVDLSQWFVIKVILEKSRDEVSLMEQDSIENVSKPIKFFEKNIFFNFFKEKKCLYNFILCNFLVWTLQFFHFVFHFFCLTTKT